VADFAPSPPSEWSALADDPPLFASTGWLTVMGHRLEGTHRYFIEADATGFFGSAIADGTVTATKNPWDLLFDPLHGIAYGIQSSLDSPVGEP
jgi:hypothetical protein